MASFKNIVAVLFGLFLLLSLTQSIFRYLNNLEFYNTYKNEYEKTAKKNQELKTQIGKLEDSFEFEKTARDKFNYHLQNEKIIVLVEPTPTSVILTPTKVPNFKLWWGALSGSDPE